MGVQVLMWLRSCKPGQSAVEDKRERKQNCYRLDEVETEVSDSVGQGDADG